jgi:hypothetical protein
MGTADIYLRPTSNALSALRKSKELLDKRGAAAFGRSKLAA